MGIRVLIRNLDMGMSLLVGSLMNQISQLIGASNVFQGMETNKEMMVEVVRDTESEVVRNTEVMMIKDTEVVMIKDTVVKDMAVKTINNLWEEMEILEILKIKMINL